MLASLVAKCLTCAIPAFIASSAITPVCTIADVAVVKIAFSGDPIRSTMTACQEFQFDEKSSITFAGMLCTLLATNAFDGGPLGSIPGVLAGTGFSAWKDSVFMGGSLSRTTRVLFVAKDVLSILPSVSRPSMCFLHRVFLVLLSQIPCTLLHSLAMDIHIFAGPGKRRRRVLRSFLANYPIRITKTVLGSALACHINFGLVRVLGP
jgi:hypothetical protein